MHNELYNHMTTNEAIFNGWNAAGITQALDEGLEKLSDLDPHQVIDPVLTLFEEEFDVSKFIDTPEECRKVLGFFPVLHSDDKDDDDFEPEWNFSDVFDTYVNE